LGNFFGHVFLPAAWRSSLLLAFYHLKSIKKKTKAMCCKRVGAKSMTKKLQKGTAIGELRGFII